MKNSHLQNIARRRLACTGIVFLSLSGCIDSASLDKSELVQACSEEGNSRASCVCMADLAHESLQPIVFAAMVEGAAGRTEEAAAAYSQFSVEQQQSVRTFVERVVPACNMIVR